MGLADPFSGIETCMEPAFGQIEVRARRDSRSVKGSLEAVGSRLHARASSARMPVSHPAGLTHITRPLVRGSDRARGPQPQILTRRPYIAHPDQSSCRSWGTQKSPLERNSIATSPRHPSCGKFRANGPMESVQEHAGSLPGRCPTRDPHPPTETAVCTCCPMADPSGAPAEPNLPTIS